MRSSGWKKLILGSVIGVIIIGIVFLSKALEPSDALVLNRFEPMRMAESSYSPSDFVGDLGGVPVTIPHYFAKFVEYEGDPGWSPRKDPEPKRDFHSKFVSFGFEVRYPDMAGLSSDVLKENYRSFNIYNTPWINVGVTTGRNYGDGFFLKRKFKSIYENRSFLIEHLPNKQFELDVYTPIGVNIETRHPFKIHSDDEDFFVFRGADGEVSSLIVCSNVQHAAAPCNLYFSLEPNLKARIKIHFRRGLLSEWKKMQSSVTKLILNFEFKIET